MEDETLEMIVIYVAVGLLFLALASYLYNLNKEGLEEVSTDTLMSNPVLPDVPNPNESAVEDDQAQVEDIIKRNNANSETALNGNDLMPNPDATLDNGVFNEVKINSDQLVNIDRYIGANVSSLTTSRKNINRDIRGNVPIPKDYKVTPWNNSSVDPQPIGHQL